MVKFAVVAPAGTVTLAGTDAIEGLLLDSLTTTPPDGAEPLNVTVPVEEAPPVTVAGFNDTKSWLTVSVALWVMLL
jgi:hypothetical protein